MTDIGARARELGIQLDYEGVGGTRHEVPEETLEKLVAAFEPAPAMRPQALEALKLLAGFGEPLIGRLLLIDALSSRFRELRVKRDPHCAVCGSTDE